MNRNTTYKPSAAHTVKQHFMSNIEARSTLLVAALVLGAAGAAHAQTDAAAPASPPSQMGPAATSPAQGGIPQNRVTSKDLDAIFLKADANKDGNLDRKEAESLAAVAQRFEQLDANRDGLISRAEFSKVAGS
jgi:uncharacterized protein HemX